MNKNVLQYQACKNRNYNDRFLYDSYRKYIFRVANKKLRLRIDVEKIIVILFKKKLTIDCSIVEYTFGKIK